MEFQHDAGRWSGLVDGAVVTALDTVDDGRVVAMVRTVTNPPFRGRGYAAEIVAHAVAEAEAAGRRVRPMCWYVEQWFDQHPEHRHLLA